MALLERLDVGGRELPANFDGDTSHTALRQAVYERVLERFGFATLPDPDIVTLNTVVRQWSRQVGYDNVQKRIFIDQARTGAFPVQDPNEFFEAFLAHGTSGGCWPSAEAMFGLLRLTGFDVSRVAGTMPQVPDPMRPAHGAVDVRIDGRCYRADPSLGAEASLELIVGTPTEQASPAHGIWSEGDNVVWWRPGHSRTPLSVVTWLHDLSGAFFAYRNEATKQFSIFNTSLYVRKNRDNGVLTYGRGKLCRVDSVGDLTAEDVAPSDLPTLLIETFGLSEEIVESVPLVDDDGVKF
jgi:arylamine N-acetyltransferase